MNHRPQSTPPVPPAKGARTAGKMLVGCAIGVWMLAALNLFTSNTGRPLTVSQRQWLAQSRAHYWSCVRNTKAALRPMCHSRQPIMLSTKPDPVSVAINVLTLPLLALLGLITLLGASLGLFLAPSVARGSPTTIRLARWTTGLSAAGSVILFVLGYLPETFTAAGTALTLCFFVLMCVRTSPPLPPEKTAAPLLRPVRT